MSEQVLFLSIYGFLLLGTLVYLLPKAILTFRREVARVKGGAEPPQSVDQSTDFINFIDIFVLLFVFLLYYSSGKGEVEVSEMSLFIALSAQSFLIIMTIAVIAFRVNVIQLFGLTQMRWKHLGWSAIIITSAWLVTYLLQLGGYFSFLESYYGKPPLQEAVQALQTSENTTLLWLIGIVACIGAPLSEEVLFRGYVFPIVKRFTAFWPAALLSGLFFAVIHYNLASLPTLFVMGVLLAVAYEYTRSLWVPIIAHCVFNSATVLSQVIMRAQGLTPDLS